MSKNKDLMPCGVSDDAPSTMDYNEMILDYWRREEFAQAIDAIVEDNRAMCAKDKTC